MGLHEIKKLLHNKRDGLLIEEATHRMGEKSLSAGEKGTLIHCLWECKLVEPLWKTIWRLLEKLKIDLPYDPAIPLLGIYLKECESGYNKGTCTPMFIAALFTITKLWKQPRCPTTDK
jgi:hypothetical protein